MALSHGDVSVFGLITPFSGGRHHWLEWAGEWVLGDERGRRFIYNILLMCHPDEDWMGVTTEALIMQCIGRRHIGLWVTNLVRAIDPSLIERMAYEFVLPPAMPLVKEPAEA